MKALVIDDEELARKRVLSLLSKVPEIEVSGECSNGKSAISEINKLNPDLVFLDINMKDMNGF
ncbi:LytR/AlgR family response regulator transcription factor [Marixanthomonas ophiurae]|uniref:LytR/AlgR family response regulator transcription factor n=1 Tax=Marixanthomonas ophiurae TaxID=387659 RepID=UPI001EFEEDC8|nr:response regulator [Marixanthomonas ophiurae]